MRRIITTAGLIRNGDGLIGDWEPRMPQMPLFETSDVLLADDERGRISYMPHFVDAATAAAWFAELRTGVQWRSERRMMYDREVDVPRLIGHFRLDSPAAVPAAIRDAAQRVTA